jgi:hypothetical protein
MANNNKVLYNVDQTADTTDVEKAQARANIGASDGTISWVSYSEGSPTPVIDNSKLAVVSSDSGTRIQNDDASKKYYVAPDTTSSDKGKFFGVNSAGAATWQNVPNPPQDVFMESQTYNQRYIESNTNILNMIQCPKHDGKYPTKVIGSFMCTPESDCNSISIVPMASALYDSVSGWYYTSPYESSQNVNVNKLLALTDTDSDGTYNNTVTFQFHKNPRYVPGNKDITNIGIKGIPNMNAANYHIHNVNITYFYESDDNANNQ